MKTKEFIDLLQKVDPSGELEVIIPVCGGIGGPYAGVTGAHKGFDWYNHKLCLTMSEQLVFYSTYKYHADQAAHPNNVILCKINYDLCCFITKTKAKFKKDQVIEVRTCGGTDKLKIKILEELDNEKIFLPYPAYRAEIIK